MKRRYLYLILIGQIPFLEDILLNNSHKHVFHVLEHDLKDLLFICAFIDLYLAITAADAAETAKLYGAACAVIYPAVNLLISNMRVRKPGVSVSPDFEKEKMQLYIHIKARIRPVRAIWQYIKWILGAKILN